MISTEMIIWLAVVGVASVGMLLGVFALTNRINAIDERLFGPSALRNSTEPWIQCGDGK
jgi:hypothetical protein